MAIFDTISFPQTDAITGRPTIDGWTDNIDPGIVTQFAESGYAAGGRIAFAGGAIAPPVTFQCTQVQVNSGADVGLPTLAAGSYLAMGFFCTFDPTFDEQDGLTIALRPDFAAAAHTNARRIDLLPNSTAGAGPASAVIDTIPGAPETYSARLNRDLFNAPTFWKGAGTNANPTDLTQTRWTAIAVNNCFAKCASWHPNVPNTNAKPAQTVPSSPATVFTLAVDDVSQFPDTGNLTVPIVGNPAVTVSYTGRDVPTNTFTGCKVKAGSTGGTADTAAAVELPDLSWSVEVIIPTTAALGGADWVDLTGHFGLYVNLFRSSQFQPTPPAQPHAGFLAAQYRFPLPDASATVANQHFLTGFLDDKLYLGDDWYGQASLLTLTGGVNDAQGVCFQNISSPASSVGVRHPGSPTPSTLTGQIYGTTGTVFPNTLVAQIQNTNPTNAANNVTAEFRFGKWGNPPTAFAQWDPHNPKFTTTPASVPTTVNLAAGGGSAEITADWPNGDVPLVYAGDTCMWVRLDSTSNAAFAQDGVRRNIMFTNLSESEQDATISGSGYPAGSGSHDFLLLTHVRELVGFSRGGDAAIRANLATGAFTEGKGQENVLGWYWVVETFRRTGLEFNVAGQQMEVIDPSPGQFGAFAAHQNDGSDVFQHALWGGGLRRLGNNTYGLRVPHNGEVTIHTWLGAGPPGTVKPPPGSTETGQGGGCLGFLLPLLNWIRSLLK
ncbi:MAG TPA: hypothetical protein VH108_01510 [Gaiellaceae bacterium]|nr:hypothetical protein [Gaiellaceae bacterium]